MEYIYAAMLSHKSGGKIEEAAVKKVLEAAGAKVDDARIKALVASLEGVNIDDVILKASQVQVAAVASGPAPAAEGKKSEDDSKKKAEDEKKTEESAAAGLSALFG
jgi:large subunit ribosomal protein L12